MRLDACSAEMIRGPRRELRPTVVFRSFGRPFPPRVFVVIAMMDKRLPVLPLARDPGIECE